MKKFSLIIIFMLKLYSAYSQVPAHPRGMYVDRFFRLSGSSTPAQVDPNFTLLGFTAKENEILEYAQKNHFTYLLLYDVYFVMQNETLSYNGSTALEHLCNFMHRAKNDYCIESIGVAGAGETFFTSQIPAFASPPIQFTTQEINQLGANNPLLMVQDSINPGDSLFAMAEQLKYYLKVAHFNSSDAARFGVVSPTCGNGEHFDVITTEYEFWNNTSPDDYGYSLPSQKYPDHYQPLVRAMDGVKSIAGYPMLVESYIAYLNDVNSCEWGSVYNQCSAPACPTFTDHYAMAQWIDGIDAGTSLKRVDRIMTTYYTNGYDPDIYNSNDVQVGCSLGTGDLHTQGYYVNRFLDFCSPGTQPLTNIQPLFGGESFFYNWVGVSGGSNFLGNWFSQGPSNNIWKVEKDFYDDWAADITNNVHDAVLKNDIVPGSAQWFNSPALLSSAKFQNPFISNSPVCTGTQLIFTYQGPIEQGYQWDFRINDGTTDVFSSLGNTWNAYVSPTQPIIIPSPTSALPDGNYTAHLTLHYKNSTNCFYDFTLPVRVGISNATELTASDDAVCAGVGSALQNSHESIIFQASDVPGASYVWSIISGNGGSLAPNGSTCIFTPPDYLAIGQTPRLYTIQCVVSSSNSACQITQTKVITVNPNPLLGVSNSCAPISIGGNALTVTSLATINATYLWSDLSTNSTLYANTNGFYSVLVTEIVGGCQQLISYKVSDLPSVPVLTSPITGYCKNSTTPYTLTISNPRTGVTYTWYRNGSVISGANGSSYTENSPPLNGPVLYFVTAQGVSPCSVNSNLIQIDVTTVTVTASALPNAICNNGATVQLQSTSTGGTSFVWTPGPLSGSTVNIQPNISSPYVVVASGANNCTASASVQVTVNPLPSVSIVGTSPICANTPLTLNVNAGGAGLTISQYEWYFGGSIISGQSGNTILPNSGSGNYSVVVTNSANCTTTSASVAFNVSTPVTIASLSNQTVCAGKQIQLIGNISGGINTGHWSVSAPATGTFSPNTAQNAVYSFSDADLSSGISSLVFTLTSDDPTGPCPSVSATMTVTVDKNCCGNYNNTISQTDFNTSTLTLTVGKNVYSSSSIITLAQNLLITGGALSFPANYQIIVPSGITLTLSNTHLHACGDMWQGIIVEPGGSLIVNPNTLIEDAENAVLLRQTTTQHSNLSCDHATFSGNYIGIKMEANSGLNFNNIGMSIVSSTFNSPNITLRHSGNLTTSNQSYAGMYINNWTGIIGKYGSQQNLFDHQNIGIRSNQCVLTVMTSKFSNIHIDPIYSGIASGTGIYSEGNDPGYLLKQYGFGQAFSPSFSNCELGIYSNGVPVTIIGNNMTEMNHGILLSKLPGGSTSSVTANTIRCTYDGIISQFPEGIKNLTINADSIFVDNSRGTNNYGIGIASYDASTKSSNISILSNAIQMYRGFNGILIQGVRSNIVANNSVNFVNATVEGASGISGYDAKGNIISCNTVYGNSTISTFEQRGYHFGLSQANEISCNYATDIFYGFEFNGGCEMRNQYIGNTMKNHYVGLYLTMDGLIDEQWHRGNKWLGIYSNPNSNEAIDYNTTLSNFYVNINDGTDFNPTAPDPAIGWFNPDLTGSAFRCDEQKVCGSKEGGSNNFGDISKMIADGTYNPTDFPEESKWLARIYLFQKLLNEPTALSDPALLAFYNYNLNGNIDKINQVRLESENLDLKSASDSTILENNDSLLHETMSMIESCSRSFSDGSITEQQYNSTISNLKQVIENLVNSNKQISDALKMQKGTNADNIRSFNDVISSTEHYELNEKFVNDVYLKTVAKGTMEIPISDQSQLLSIAHECPFVGGQSVYIARSLFRLVNQTEFYDDFPLCHSIGLMRKKSTEDESSLLQSYLYPNPANNTATLAYFLEENTKTTLKIFDSSMKLSSSELLNVSDREKVINLEKLTPGLYIYSIIQNDHVISSGKFSVVH